MDAIRSGIHFEDIYSTALPKLVIFPGMADMNMADIAIIVKKSKKVLIPLFLTVILLIFILLKRIICCYSF